MEALTFTVALTAISTVYDKCSWAAFGLMAAFFLGRVMYSLAYAKFGPNARILGALIMDLALLGLVVLSVVSTALAIHRYSW